MHDRKLEQSNAVKSPDSSANKRSPTSKTITTTTITTTAKVYATKKSTLNSSSLSQRVYEFEKTARYMIKKLQETSDKIVNAQKEAVDAETIDHLKMLVAPDAATLISQGDSLVLETHGNATPDLAKTVMDIQAILREKFREVQHSK